jgi:DNA replication protein DnaC
MFTPCRECNQPIEYAAPVECLGRQFIPTVCGGCHAKREESNLAAARLLRVKAFERTCPPIYQDTDPSHPGMPPAAKLQRIFDWQYGPKGLLLHGDTRKGKTRCMWLLLKRLIIEEGREVEAITCGQFAKDCAQYYRRDYECPWMERLVEADVLFIDDLGKSKMTQRVAADLFEIFEQRCAWKRPTFFTTNFVGNTLKEKLAAQTDSQQHDHEPFIARIREFCEPIHL